MAQSIRPQLTYPISLRKLTVHRAYDVSPGLRRVELTGSELSGAVRDGFVLPPFVSDGFDDEIKLFFPDPESGELSLPVQRDRFIDWPRDPRPEARTYTVRGFDAERELLLLDFARHARGVATDWAEQCQPGAELHIAGPKMAWLHPEGADWLFIGGDDTALPALARWLETMPQETRGVALLEVPDASHEFEIRHPEGVELRWLHRGATPAARSTRLIDAVLGEPWRDGEPFCWFAGETGVLRPIRSYLRKDRELPRERVEVTGYWRAPVGDELDIDPDEEETADLHELGELVPPYALRAAVTLGVVPAIRAGARSTAQIADAIGAHPGALARLLRYLATLELLAEEHGEWRITRAGGALDDEDENGGLDLADPLAREQLAIASLLEVLRTGAPVQASQADRRERDPQLNAAITLDAAADLSYVASSFGSAEVPFAPGEHLVVAGEGALSVLAGPLTADPELRVTLLERPSRVAPALGVLPAPLRDRIVVVHGTGLDAWPRTDGTVLLLNALRGLPDADAAHLLRGAAASGARLLVLEDLLGVDEIDEHDAEGDLLELCLTGVGRRTLDEVRGVARLAGLDVSARAIGWGDLLLTLTSS